MWMTIDDRSPERLRSLVLEIYWDGAATPAVSVPLGDFFLHGAGEMKPMETELLSSAEGRSFVSCIPMPFRRGARAKFQQLLKGAKPVPLTTPGLPEDWTNFYRSDDVASVAYFYLDRPENGLPRIAPVAERVAGPRRPAPVRTPTAVQAYTPPTP